MKTPAQLEASIDRFRQRFWLRSGKGRPPVGVADSATFMPIAYLKKPFPRDHVEPNDVTHELVRTDYEHAAPRRRVFSDDEMPFCTPWRAIPWLEASCGCPVLYAEGSLRPDHVAPSMQAILDVKLPAAPGWIERMHDLTRQQVAGLAGAEDCMVSPSILRGPSDVLAAMRGQTEFFLDLMDTPDLVAKAAAKVNDLMVRVIREHFDLVPAKLGGFVHSYGYWSPQPTVVLQQDAMGMCPPEMYRDIFQPLDSLAVGALGQAVFFHMHTTGYAHHEHVMDIPGLAGVELSIESTGPSLLELVPTLRKILERTRLILFAEHFFPELPEMMRRIPHEGLFLIIPDTHIRDEEAFGRFLKAIVY
ncbi:MAG: hypothetical protein IT442_03695 [Phycisphaeraceae bacterium]|nr:hypothetical protein [Phycisphaeraceae bacterium]